MVNRIDERSAVCVTAMAFALPVLASCVAQRVLRRRLWPMGVACGAGLSSVAVTCLPREISGIPVFTAAPQASPWLEAPPRTRPPSPHTPTSTPGGSLANSAASPATDQWPTVEVRYEVPQGWHRLFVRKLPDQAAMASPCCPDRPQWIDGCELLDFSACMGGDWKPTQLTVVLSARIEEFDPVVERADELGAQLVWEGRFADHHRRRPWVRKLVNGPQIFAAMHDACADFTIRVGQSDFPVIRRELARRSPYFRSAFAPGGDLCDQQFVELDDSRAIQKIYGADRAARITGACPAAFFHIYNDILGRPSQPDSELVLEAMIGLAATLQMDELKSRVLEAYVERADLNDPLSVQVVCSYGDRSAIEALVARLISMAESWSLEQVWQLVELQDTPEWEPVALAAVGRLLRILQGEGPCQLARTQLQRVFANYPACWTLWAERRPQDVATVGNGDR